MTQEEIYARYTPLHISNMFGAALKNKYCLYSAFLGFWSSEVLQFLMHTIEAHSVQWNQSKISVQESYTYNCTRLKVELEFWFKCLQNKRQRAWWAELTWHRFCILLTDFQSYFPYQEAIHAPTKPFILPSSLLTYSLTIQAIRPVPCFIQNIYLTQRSFRMTSADWSRSCI